MVIRQLTARHRRTTTADPDREDLASDPIDLLQVEFGALGMGQEKLRLRNLRDRLDSHRDDRATGSVFERDIQGEPADPVGDGA